MFPGIIHPPAPNNISSSTGVSNRCLSGDLFSVIQENSFALFSIGSVSCMYHLSILNCASFLWNKAPEASGEKYTGGTSLNATCLEYL